MPVTLQELIDQSRSQLDEVVAAGRFWTNTELTRWINEGCRDIARRAQDLQSFTSAIPAVATVNKYPLPSNVIQIHRVEFQPTGQTQVYPLQASTYQEMDQVWGVNQQTPQSYPSYFVLWGTPGMTNNSPLQMQVYPAPSQGGLFNVFYYRMPYRFLDPVANAGELSKNAEIPEGWDDMVVLWCEYAARRKDRDPNWQEAKALYEERITQLVDVSRQWHDQGRAFQHATGAVPGWLYSFDDGLV